MTIWANCIVNNEENFIWFAVMSVVDFVDKVLIYDTGSEDKTVEIIREIKKVKGDKIYFKEVERVDKFQFPKMRQKMLDESNCDWILILDGDEIWWNDSINKVKHTINQKGDDTEGIVVPMVVPVGDIFHLQEKKAGKYKILGKTEHLSLKAFSKKIPDVHVDWPYGKEGFFDGEGRLIQEREKIVFVDAPFLHVTHLKRSPQMRKYEKFKLELGEEVGKDFKFPEVLYRAYPEFITSPWARISGVTLLKAKVLTPLRKLKRVMI